MRLILGKSGGGECAFARREKARGSRRSMERRMRFRTAQSSLKTRSALLILRESWAEKIPRCLKKQKKFFFKPRYLIRSEFTERAVRLIFLLRLQRYIQPELTRRGPRMRYAAPSGF